MASASDNIAPENTAPVLEFRSATLMAEWPAYRTLRHIELRLGAGDLAMVHVESDDAPLPLAPAAQGLIEPTRGSVLFQGHAWNDEDPWLEGRLRARIGRVFESWGWVSNLSVLENVTLSQRHHTRRPESDIEAEADLWAQRFGLPQTPRGRPANLPPDTLRRAEWVRAWLARPRLLLLEHPTRGAPPESFEALSAAVRDVRQGGAAVLWIVSDDRAWRDTELRPSSRWTVTGEELRPAQELAA